jgi:para-nitrobenzyl esterase
MRAINGGTRTLFGASSILLAGLLAATISAQSPTPLEGFSWRLVKFSGADGTTLKPADPAKYTIEFGAGGRVTARIDCNRGRGTWKSAAPGALELGELALTRAKCPAAALDDHIVRRWPLITSYAFKDGHLFLSLMADGGTYELAPVIPKTVPKNVQRKK